MATKQDIRNDGFRRGQSVASWTDMPEIGTRIRPDIDWVGLGQYVTARNQFDYWELCANASAEIPSDTREELEALAKPYDVWEVFEAGITAGIQAYGRKHHACELANAGE